MHVIMYFFVYIIFFFFDSINMEFILSISINLKLFFVDLY